MKKILYFVPTVIACVFYGIMAFIFELEPVAYLFVAMLILSSVLMCKNKWWGCIFGVAMGIWLICLDLNEKGQIKIISQWPIGLIFAVYFIVCGVVLFNKNKSK